MSDSERITELEIKITHQELLLDALNQVVIDQANQIDALKRAVEQIEHHGATGPPEIGPADEKPPHY